MNASFLEIVQTIASGLGGVLAVRSMVAADLNLVTIQRRNVNGNRRMIAAKNVRVERCNLLIQVLLFLVGLATLFLAPPPYTPVPDGGVRGSIEQDMIRNLAVTRLGMTLASLILMYLSYRSWLEERIPILLAVRHTDPRIDTASTGPTLAIIAQEAASHAQTTATLAQDAASEAQTTATLAQDAATEVNATSTGRSVTEDEIPKGKKN